MELAKITMRGQITIPVEIRKKLGVKDGDKVIFLEENGRIIMGNAAMISLRPRLSEENTGHPGRILNWDANDTRNSHPR